MKQIIFTLTLLSALPAFAQGDAPLLPDPAPPGSTEEGGVDLMQEGAKLLFRGLLGELEPMLDGMGKALEDVEPALKELFALVDDIRNYDAPRILDNGDILIPRREGAPPPRILPPSPPPVPEGEIEL